MMLLVSLHWQGHVEVDIDQRFSLSPLESVFDLAGGTSFCWKSEGFMMLLVCLRRQRHVEVDLI